MSDLMQKALATYNEVEEHSAYDVALERVVSLVIEEAAKVADDYAIDWDVADSDIADEIRQVVSDGIRSLLNKGE